MGYLLRLFMYFVVAFTTWALAIFGYLATDSKWFRACLMWAALSGVEMRPGADTTSPRTD